MGEPNNQEQTEIEVMDLIYLHTEANPIKSHDISHALGICGEKIRKAINSLRRQGFLIGSGDNGYYLCNSKKGAEEVIDSMLCRAHSITSAALAMKVKAQSKFGILQLQFNLPEANDNSQDAIKECVEETERREHV